jgi:hypothetical protein
MLAVDSPWSAADPVTGAGAFGHDPLADADGGGGPGVLAAHGENSADTDSGGVGSRAFRADPQQTVPGLVIL